MSFVHDLNHNATPTASLVLVKRNANNTFFGQNTGRAVHILEYKTIMYDGVLETVTSLRELP